jgi:type I restriction enzyme S subunit
MRDGWVEYKFKDVATAVKGKLPKNKNVDGIGIPYLTANFLRSSKPDYWIENIEGAVTAEDGDCLILWDGAGAGDLFSAHRGVVSSTMAVVTTQNSKILREFLTLFISSKAEYIKETCRGTTVPHVSPDAIANMDLKIPPLSEQKRIVDLISSVDSYIEALQQQLEKAKKSRNAVLHELLTAGGDDWVEGKVGDISVLRYGYTESANWDPIGPKFLRITDIQDGLVNWDLVPYCKISDADLSLQQLKDGDLVFARTGATTGKSFLVTNPPDSVSASYLIRLRPDQSKVNPYYLSIFFQSENYWQQVMAGTSGSAQGGVNASKLSHLKIQIPPLSRQKMISDLIEEMDIHASKIREALNRSQNLRSTMLSDLLSGDHEIPASYDKVIGAA